MKDSLVSIGVPPPGFRAARPPCAPAPHRQPAMASMQARRMSRELALLKTSAPPGVAAWPAGDGSRVDDLDAEIAGAAETPYAGGVFRLRVSIPPEYPIRPPGVRFVTRIYHPNIDTQGRICLDTLNMPPKGAWKPSLNVSTVLASVQLLMSHPNPEDGLMADITEEFRRAPDQFVATARAWTARYAAAGAEQPEAREAREAREASSAPQARETPEAPADAPAAVCPAGGGRAGPASLADAGAAGDAGGDACAWEPAAPRQGASGAGAGDGAAAGAARGARASPARRPARRKLVLSPEADDDHVSESSDDGAPAEAVPEGTRPAPAARGPAEKARASASSVARGDDGTGGPALASTPTRTRGDGGASGPARAATPTRRRETPTRRRSTPPRRRSTPARRRAYAAGAGEEVVVLDLDSDGEEEGKDRAPVAEAAGQTPERRTSGRKRRVASQETAPTQPIRNFGGSRLKRRRR